MSRIDYDDTRFKEYLRGRALSEQQMQTWINAFAARLPERRPLAGLDVGCGAGRFTPALADAFGPVTGVEPSTQMRETAEAVSQHPDVRYLAGSAEELPVATAGADYALMVLAWHHVQDRPKAARELARAVRPGGRLLMMSSFSDHMAKVWWLEQFPRGPEVDAAMFPALPETISTFVAAGWRVAEFGTVLEPSGSTRGELLDRLRLRTHSVFDYFTPHEVEAGFQRIEAATAEDPDAVVPPIRTPLLTLERC